MIDFRRAGRYGQGMLMVGYARAPVIWPRATGVDSQSAASAYIYPLEMKLYDWYNRKTVGTRCNGVFSCVYVIFESFNKRKFRLYYEKKSLYFVILTRVFFFYGVAMLYEWRWKFGESE